MAIAFDTMTKMAPVEIDPEAKDQMTKILGRMVNSERLNYSMALAMQQHQFELQASQRQQQFELQSSQFHRNFSVLQEQNVQIVHQVGKLDAKIDRYATNLTHELQETKNAARQNQELLTNQMQEIQITAKQNQDQITSEMHEIKDEALKAVNNAVKNIWLEQENRSPAIASIHLIWNNPEHRILRQFFAIVNLIGLDTMCATGAMPFVTFDYADPANPDPKQIVAVISKTVINLLKIYNTKFKNGIHGAVTNFWKKLVLLEHTSKISAARSKEWALMFPFAPYVSDNVVYIALDIFIEYMHIEHIRTSSDMVRFFSF